jgi:glutamate/tyrosine decarboxylase-like PLP-dependent enzyme
MTKEHRIDIECLQQMMKGDQARGLVPFVAVGTAGTVDAGAVDDLQALATVCKEHEAWFHADAAFGAMLALSPSRRQMIQGIELADSVALDLHKWGQVPYDAGMVIAKDSNALVEAFSTDRAYLAGSQRGIAAGRPWPCDMGPDLSRGGRAIAAWMTMKAYGAAAFGEVVDRSCETAAAMARRITSEPSLELLAPVATNIVCFRVREHPENIDLDALNRWIVEEIQLSGSAVPSTTRIDGKLAIRAAVVNHRTTTADGLVLIDEVLRVAKKRQTARSTA